MTGRPHIWKFSIGIFSVFGYASARGSKVQSAATHSERTRGAMIAANFGCIARVGESGRAVDLAMSLSPTQLFMVRCVDRFVKDDHIALATMISQGDFIWGAVVYDQSEVVGSLGLIESFHVSQVDQLVARLIELREVFGESG